MLEVWTQQYDIMLQEWGWQRGEGCRQEGIKWSLLGQSSEERRRQPRFRWTDKNTLCLHFNSHPLMCGPRATFIISATGPQRCCCCCCWALWKVQGSSQGEQTEPINRWRLPARKRTLCMRERTRGCDSFKEVEEQTKRVFTSHFCWIMTEQTPRKVTVGTCSWKIISIPPECWSGRSTASCHELLLETLKPGFVGMKESDVSKKTFLPAAAGCLHALDPSAWTQSMTEDPTSLTVSQQHWATI